MFEERTGKKRKILSISDLIFNQSINHGHCHSTCKWFSCWLILIFSFFLYLHSFLLVVIELLFSFLFFLVLKNINLDDEAVEVVDKESLVMTKMKDSAAEAEAKAKGTVVTGRWKGTKR